MAFFEFDTVSFSYDGTRNVLDEVSLALESGTFTCIVGGNGSGKSTLVRHLNALLMPTSGTVRVDGMPTSETTNHFKIRQRVGMVFQNPDDQIVASVVEDDVAFGPENLGLPTADIRKRVTDALKLVGLEGYEHRQTTALSGGEKQRVAIAGALAMRPEALVLDEPGAMLDPEGRHAVLDVCRTLHDEGLTIVLITHFMEEVTEAERVVALDGGRIAFDGTPHDFLVQTPLLSSLGLEAPTPVRISQALQEQGLNMATHLDEHSLVEELVALIRNRTNPSQPL